jgi:hypothetical protein
MYYKYNHGSKNINSQSPSFKGSLLTDTIKKEAKLISSQAVKEEAGFLKFISKFVNDGLVRQKNTFKALKSFLTPKKPIPPSLEEFKSLEKVAKEYGVHAIYRDNIELAKNTNKALEILSENGHDLSNINVVISEKAAKKSHKLVIAEIINANKQQISLIPEKMQKLMGITPEKIEKKLLKSKVDDLGGLARLSLKGEQHPVIFLNPGRLSRNLKKTLATKDEKHIPMHELFHALHFKNLYKDFKGKTGENIAQAKENLHLYQINEFSNTRLTNSFDLFKIFKTQFNISHQISSYAGSSPLEFVAEYATAKTLGKNFKKILETTKEYYQDLKGPKV